MKFFTAALSLAASVAAQDMAMSVVPAPSPPAPGGAMTHTVIVGGVAPSQTGGVTPQLIYKPEAIQAAVGDTVQFMFMQKNHTATQSTFAEPCRKMEGGMDSGFMANPEGKPGVTWDMTVDTTEPLWFYCKQQTGIHCGKGMVFSINAALTGDKTMEAFKQLAVNTNGTGLAPGAIQQPDPAGAAVPTTVTVVAGGPGATGAPPAAPPAGEVAAPPAGAPPAQVVGGQGQDGQGQVCSCSCLCGVNSFPAQAAIGAFGGFAGMMS